MRPDLPNVIARWKGTPGTLAHVRDGANAVYEFRVGSARLFLRLTRNAHRSRDQLEAELDFVRYLASRGVAVARPVSSVNDAWVERAAAADGELWHAVAFAAAPGCHFRYFSGDIDRPLFRAWGAAIGALHAASREFVPASSRRRPSWTEQDTTCCDDTRLASAETEARREHVRVAEWLASRGATAQSWGLIHGDFGRTNFRLDGNTVHVYDFDDACYHWYMADIAHALWAFRHAPPAERERFLMWFLDGYREHSPVDADARVQLSWFVRLRSLSLFIHHRRAGSRGRSSVEWERRQRAAFAQPFWW